MPEENSKDVDTIVDSLRLEPLPQEGGWFRRVVTGEPNESGRPRFTTIYALFSVDRFSALHRLDAHECFYWQGGDPFDVFTIDRGGEGMWKTLGRDSNRGQELQMAFEPGVWFGGRVSPKGVFGYTLMSCSVAPGFEWRGFEIGNREWLLETYPNHRDAIIDLTR